MISVSVNQSLGDISIFTFSEKQLSPAQCSAVSYLRLHSQYVRNEWNLNKYNTSEEGYRRLIPAVTNCRRAIFTGCNLTEEFCKSLASPLQTEKSSLKELDFSYSNLQDSGVEQLSAGLKSSHCQLETLRLTGCYLSVKSCEYLTSALQTENSSLKHLDLNNNYLQDSGVEQLSAGLKNSHCKLETLRLAGCSLTKTSCEYLKSALQTENSLKQLELNNNNLDHSGVEHLCDGLKSSHCKLEILRLAGCSLTKTSCEYLKSALQTENSLKQLELNNNNLDHSGVEHLCAGMKSSHCKLEILRLAGCSLTKTSCEYLKSALQTENSLKQLELNNNNLDHSGVEHLCEGLKSSHCKLEILRLAGCSLTKTSCEYLKSALQTKNSLKQLELNNNNLDHSGVEHLCAGLKSSHCKLEILRLASCYLTVESCKSLTPALQTENSSLKHLDLNNNNLQDSGVEQLSDGLKNSHCKLETLSLALCNLGGKTCENLASFLQLANSLLMELDLSNNDLNNSGVEQLSAGLKSSHCKLETLRLSGCNLTVLSCKYLTSAVQTKNSSLKELDFSYSNLQDSGVEQLSAGLKSSHCKLETLRLTGCYLSEKSCEYLTSALQTENSSLKLLDLNNNNNLQDSGVEQLSDGLKNSHCKLETLRLAGCDLTVKSCEYLTSNLQKENSLKHLDLNNNNLQDSVVEQLSAGLKSSHCKLETLRLAGCHLTVESCKSLTPALQTEISSLKHLDLNNNNLQDSGVEQLSAGLKSSHCKLETLRLSGCLVTVEGCSSLASALSSNPSHLKELDLTYNHPGASGVKLLSARLEDPHCRLDTLRVDHTGMMSIKSGLRKYVCEFTLDPNTAHKRLSLSEGNRKVTWGKQQTYPDHPDRFDQYANVLSRESVCGESVCGRCYWEAEWSGRVSIAVTYKGISRKGDSYDCRFGWNIKSWSLYCSNNRYAVCHNNKETDISVPSSSNRVGVYVDWPAGTLSFYSVSSHTHTLTHLHTFNSTFTQPLYAGVGLFPNSSVCVCVN
ncbi:uncharacterized protein LOC143492533 [Brachyhypopomus gauderio]|uniref:uncharacterized protein LOC143492533 n=1 Tax=Brachyhypopomus gauderio TaxID=698409 RepID=UPI0040418094